MISRVRSTVALVAVFAMVSGPTVTFGQRLTDMGMFASGTVSRSRLGGEDFQLGDMMYVAAIQPANSGGMYVSAHMEYEDTQQGWLPVPTASTPLGQAYRSGKYVGLRDYVQFGGTGVGFMRHICLFMPYDAAALPGNKVYERRYVIRVWDGNNQEVANTVLPSETVSTTRQGGKLTLVVARAKACSSMMDAADNTPIPQSEDTGLVRFFSTGSGKWVCRAQ